MARLKRQKSRRAPLRDTGNTQRRRTVSIKPSRIGHKPGLNYDSIESLIEYGEGERHR